MQLLFVEVRLHYLTLYLQASSAPWLVFPLAYLFAIAAHCPLRKKHVESKWQKKEWTKYSMAPSKKGSSYPFYTLCNTDISIAGRGVHEVKCHSKSVTHKTHLDRIQYQPSLIVVLSRATAESLFRDGVLKSEICFARFVEEHNIQLTLSQNCASVFFHIIVVPNSSKCMKKPHFRMWESNYVIATRFSCVSRQTAIHH